MLKTSSLEPFVRGRSTAGLAHDLPTPHIYEIKGKFRVVAYCPMGNGGIHPLADNQNCRWCASA
jgi:hypothetical protein